MKHRIVRYIALFLLAFAGTLPSVADLTFSQAAGGFPIVAGDANAVFIVGENDAEVVRTVAHCVIQDIKSVTGQNLSLSTTKSLPRPLQRRGEPTGNGSFSLGEGWGENVIIAGTIGQSVVLDDLIADGKVDTTGLTGVWEAYALQLVQNPAEGISQALVVMGGTPLSGKKL